MCSWTKAIRYKVGFRAPFSEARTGNKTQAAEAVGDGSHGIQAISLRVDLPRP